MKYKLCSDVLDLFSVPSSGGREDFERLCDCTALMILFPQYGYSLADVAALGRRQRKLSPVVYWSRMKRVIAPLLEADAATLHALGLLSAASAPVPDTVPAMAAMIAAALADGWRSDRRDYAASARALAEFVAYDKTQP